jgi:hypothetical protein
MWLMVVDKRRVRHVMNCSTSLCKWNQWFGNPILCSQNFAKSLKCERIKAIVCLGILSLWYFNEPLFPVDQETFDHIRSTVHEENEAVTEECTVYSLNVWATATHFSVKLIF